MAHVSDFIDFYEVLEISPNAGAETVERMFRYFAQRYHPDNLKTANRDRFDAVLKAHKTLKDPVTRAEYDVRHRKRRGLSGVEPGDTDGIGSDIEIENKILSLLYKRRRENMMEPGLGDFEVAKLVGDTATHLEFHLWYLKEKGWICRSEYGKFEITVAGIDYANSEHQRRVAEQRLIERKPIHDER